MVKSTLSKKESVSLLQICLSDAKTEKIRGINKSAWPKWALFFAGLAACGRYLIRVIPKPSRAAYPCLRAAAPLRTGFLAYCAALGGNIAYPQFCRLWVPANSA
jgi:hypothetical protein